MAIKNDLQEEISHRKIGNQKFSGILLSKIVQARKDREKHVFTRYNTKGQSHGVIHVMPAKNEPRLIRIIY